MTILNSASKIAMLSVVFALIGLTAFQIEILEPLKTVSLMIIWYYFSSWKPQWKDVQNVEKN